MRGALILLLVLVVVGYPLLSPIWRREDDT